MDDKTNVMRILDKMKTSYIAHWYPSEGALSGVEVAALLHIDERRVFKTLVTVGRSGAHYVFVIPVVQELNLKKAAQAVSEKSVEMVKSKELLPLTGYVHGGCSPIGMKKPFPTVVDSSAEAFEQIIFSAGRIGAQVELAPPALALLVHARFAQIV